MVIRNITHWVWLTFALFGLLGAPLTWAERPPAAQDLTNQAPGVLTTVEQVRAINQQSALPSHKVRLQGRVLALSGFRNFFFMQDGTAGIAVDRTDDAVVHAGDLVSLEGVSQAGSFAPVVVASAVRVKGRAAAPRAQSETYSDLVGGAHDSQWVEVQGIVHSIGMSKLWTHDTLALNVDMDGGSIVVHLQDYAGLDLQQFVDAKVRVRGICATNFNNQRQFVGLLLVVPSRTDLDILHPAPKDPFSAPSLPVRSVMQFNPAWKPGHMIRVEGIATYQSPGRRLFLQQGEDAIEIETATPLEITLGSLIEAVGFPVVGDYAPLLKDSTVRVKAAGSPVKARHIDANQVFSQHLGFLQAPFDEHLVEMEADVVESELQENGNVWILRGGGKTFTAHLPLLDHLKDGSGTGAGSRLLLTGICKVHTDASRNPISFELLLRSSEDVRVLRQAPWWTPKRAFSVIGALGGGALLVMLWVIALRKRVREQIVLLSASEQRYRDMAERDVLTGLPNRLFLEERVAKCLALSGREQVKAAVLTIDIDYFKRINDTFGHTIGDDCLKEVASRLTSKVRSIDTIARTGGEEFTLIVGRLRSKEDAQKVCSSLLQLFQEPLRLSRREMLVTVSIGVAMYPDDGASFDRLRIRSDQALYDAKRAGRNRAEFATSMHTEQEELEHGRECCASAVEVS